MHVVKPAGVGYRAIRTKSHMQTGLTHSGVCLGDTTRHASKQTGNSRVDTHAKRRCLHFGRGEDEHGTFC